MGRIGIEKRLSPCCWLEKVYIYIYVSLWKRLGSTLPVLVLEGGTCSTSQYFNVIATVVLGRLSAKKLHREELDRSQ
jgi:hypothetical protein